MFDSHDFFKQRFYGHIKELNRYLRYILNGHLAFAMLFFLGAFAYYYQQWLSDLPADFPTAWIIGIVFGSVAAFSPVQTLLKEPDLVFLIPVEHKMGPYFRDGLIYSFVIQLYMVFMFGAALGPLYFHTYPKQGTSVYLLIIGVLLIFKVWNLLANWWMLRVRDPNLRRLDSLARWVFSVGVFFFLAEGWLIFAAVATILFIIVFLYDWLLGRRQAGIAWDLLLEKDQNRMQAFYRLANMFTDVPHLKSRIKKRRLITHFAQKGRWGQRHTYDYLYRLTYIRSDYLGMYMRLVVIGGLVIWFVPNVWMKAVFAVLFLYLTSFQMMALYHHHRTIIWLDLYPIQSDLRKQALLRLMRWIGSIEVVVFALTAVKGAGWAGAALVLAAGILFMLLFHEGYVRHKLG